MIEGKDDLFEYFNSEEKGYIVDGTLARKNLPKTRSEVEKMTIRKISSKRYEILPASEQTPRKVAKKEIARIIEMDKAKEPETLKRLKQSRKENLRIEKLAKKQEKREAKKRDKRVAKLYKQLNNSNMKRYKREIDERYKEEEKIKNDFEKRRITPPKKRNIFSRLHNINKYNRGEFDYEESKVDNYKKGRENIRDLTPDWEEIQKYEDARDSVALRRGWTAFKVTLAGLALAGALFSIKMVANEIKDTMNQSQKTQITSVADMDSEQRANFEIKSLMFQNEITQRDGYVFDYLSKEEITDGYFKLLNYESRIYEGRFKGTSFALNDQEFLDKVLQETFGTEKINSLTAEQKRDYKQLAFETFYEAQPKYFNNETSCIRNPIVIDHLNAREVAQGKGYYMHLKVNNLKFQTVKNLGTLIHQTRNMTISDLDGINLEDGGKEYLESMLKNIIGDSYAEMQSSDKRDYLQIAYEMLPDSIRGNYIKDPIGIEKETGIIGIVTADKENDDKVAGR